MEEQALLDSVQKAFVKDAAARAHWMTQTAQKKRLSTVSAREQQVLELVVAGRANKMIAFELGISEKTVDFHRANIKKKTGTDSVAELVQLVLATQTSDLEVAVLN